MRATGTQTRDTATVTYRMAPLYKDSSLWNIGTRTTFIARLIMAAVSMSVQVVSFQK